MIKKIIFSVLLSLTIGYTQYTNLLNFAGATNGKNPYGSLIYDGTFLFGMTQVGGVNDMGTLFKIKPDGTGYVNLLNFDSANGSFPHGSLIYDGTFLYGMTDAGGTNNMGTIFKIMPDGTGYVNLLNFIGVANGRNPQGTLFYDGTFLYGMTAFGGTGGKGTLFKIMPDGTGFVKLLDFAGATNGRSPLGSLITDGTFLYGMTKAGGTNDLGTLFKIMPDGTGYVKLLDFAGASNGSLPYGSLIMDGTFLYGMTNEGGANDMGTLFKIMPNGSGYVNILNFDGATHGSFPWGSPIMDGTFIYGMTFAGGANDMGTLFKIKPDGTGYLDLLDFDGVTKGSFPYGSPTTDGTFLYGMTTLGGASNDGTVFKYQYSFAGIADDSQEINLQAYPNPTADKINIVCETDQKNAMIEISDMTGRTVMAYKYVDLIAGENYVMDISILNKGFYVLRINNHQMRIIKE